MFLLSNCRQVLGLYHKISVTASVCVLYRLPCYQCYVTSAINKLQHVRKWCGEEFANGKVDIHNDHTGSTSTIRMDVNGAQVQELILEEQ